jgi:prostaglandin-endoperoxide synthase 2
MVSVGRRDQPMSRFGRKDGLLNTLQLWGVTHLPGLWRFVARVGVLRSAANNLIINTMVYKLKTRPDVLSTMSQYTSWASLTDRTYSDRHLPPDPHLQTHLPPAPEVVELFRRSESGGRPSKKSTLLFPHFAQWFVDGFLRTDPKNPLKNTSTHDIDLSQLYGQTAAVTTMLRTLSGGRLKSQPIDDREYPPYYFGEDGKVKPEFAELPLTYPDSDLKAAELGELDDWERRKLFALGIPRGNIHYGFTMMSTLFLREHNRLAGDIAKEHDGDPDWDDERIFQTARNTLIVLLLKIVIEDYINHITPFYFKLFVKPGLGADQKWYRQNWMSIEFNLLYRWHTLVPTSVRAGGAEHDMASLRWNNDIVVSHGLGFLFDEASRQPCCEIGLLNTAPFLLDIEQKTIEIGRAAALASYNDYRLACGYPPMGSFADISSDPDVQSALEQCYASVDDVELYVGLFAEDVVPMAALPTLMGTMVGVDAFSQALTNPLLTKRIFKEETFSAAGMKAIAKTTTLADIVKRNLQGEDVKPLVTLTHKPETESAGASASGRDVSG